MGEEEIKDEAGTPEVPETPEKTAGEAVGEEETPADAADEDTSDEE